MDNFKWVRVIKGNLIKDNENEEEEERNTLVVDKYKIKLNHNNI